MRRPSLPNDLIAVVHGYSPRGRSYNDSKETEESNRLVQARKRASAESATWRSMLSRMSERFPEKCVQDGSLHLPMGIMDAGYVGALFSRSDPKRLHPTVEFHVSFLAPYHFIYFERTVLDTEALKAHRESSSTFISVVTKGERQLLKLWKR